MEGRAAAFEKEPFSALFGTRSCALVAGSDAIVACLLVASIDLLRS